MKKLITIMVTLLLFLALVGCQKKTTSNGFKAGVYEGSAKGKNGDVVVKVTLTSDKIEKVEVTKHEETEGIAEGAIEKITSEVVKKQSLAVDVATGATITSNAILEAIKDALAKAGVDSNNLANKTSNNSSETQIKEADIVVVGAGGSGMVAALQAAQQGKKVIIVEKKSIVGGNTTLSTGGMNAAKTEYQDKNKFEADKAIAKKLALAKEKYPELNDLVAKVEQQYQEYLNNPSGYFDSTDLFMLDTLVGGKNLNNPKLVEQLVNGSAEGIKWLSQFGADLKLVGSFGGASVKRIHKPVNAEGKSLAVGSYLVPILEKACKEKGIEIIFEAKASEILMKDGVAVGVKADGYQINAKAVILATGGFAGNLEMVEQYKPELKGFASTNTSGIEGDGIKMAQAVGADVVDMNQIQIHPTVEFKSKALITEGLRGDGAILVNNKGLRFTDEVNTRDAVSKAEIEQDGGFAWLVIDQTMVDKSSVIAGYIKKGFTVKGETIKDLAKAMEVDATNLENTLISWNKKVESKSDDEFNRTSFAEKLEKAPFYAIKVSPGVHHTMGGIKINENAEVIDTKGQVIKGLFAAGEVCGGVHGGNRLGGNAVADVVVFGRIAGNSAAKY